MRECEALGTEADVVESMPLHKTTQRTDENRHELEAHSGSLRYFVSCGVFICTYVHEGTCPCGSQRPLQCLPHSLSTLLPKAGSFTGIEWPVAGPDFFIFCMGA